MVSCDPRQAVNQGDHDQPEDGYRHVDRVLRAGAWAILGACAVGVVAVLVLWWLLGGLR